MIKLLLIADDSTGALDSSYYFATKGAATVVQLRPQFSWDALAENTEILAVNSASRHLSAAEAAACVRSLVEEGRKQNVGMIFKKIDSALRGNPGSELEAVLLNTSSRQLYLMPAYPSGGRTTVGGVQLWEGVPIADTAYRHDPFDPVDESNVRAVLSRQTKLPIIEVSEQMEIPNDSGILILDASDDEQIACRCRQILRRSSPIIMGGCAGMAAALAHCLYPNGHGRKEAIPRMPLLVVSGSLHPVAKEQMAYGRQLGLPYYALRAEHELRDGFISSREGKLWLSEVRNNLQQNRTVLLETAGGRQTVPLAAVNTISRQIAALVAALYDPKQPVALAVFGGDTLLAITAELFQDGLIPQYEIEPGIPLALAFDKQGGIVPLISKSGGFGTREVITKLMQAITETEGTKWSNS
ncbi:MAG: four-carbon acid sugar kinase family protein [Faecousia sp.]